MKPAAALAFAAAMIVAGCAPLGSGGGVAEPSQAYTVVVNWPGTTEQAFDRFIATCLAEDYDQSAAIARFESAGWRDTNPDEDMHLFIGPSDEPPVFLNTRRGRDACGVISNFDNGPRLGGMAQTFVEHAYAGAYEQDETQRPERAAVIIRSWTPAEAKRGLRLDFVAHSSRTYAGLRASRTLSED